jgi:cytochrome P450
MMRDEVFGFLVAGHDTTGTVMQWALKWITTDQSVQASVRSELHSVFKECRDAGHQLSAKELCRARVRAMPRSLVLSNTSI